MGIREFLEGISSREFRFIVKNIQISAKETDIMVSADEHFEQAMDVPRALAHTQPSGDDDHQSIDDSDADLIGYSGAEKAYVRLFVFSLFSLLFFFAALRKQ